MGAKTDALCSFGGWLLKVAADAAEPTETQRSARKVAEYKAKTEESRARQCYNETEAGNANSAFCSLPAGQR